MRTIIRRVHHFDKPRHRTFRRPRAVGLMTALLLGVSLALPGCDRTAPQATTASMPRTNGPYSIITTTAMIGDIVSNVAGDRAQVRSLMGAGVDPHLFRATREDMSAMLSADVVFYNGLSLEGKMSDAFVRVAASGKPVFAVTELLDEQYLLEPEDFGGHFDPHVWMDPKGWIKATEVVIEKLATFDAANAQVYRDNGARFVATLGQLDEYARSSLQTVPAERRVLVTAHDAFNYFSRAYGLEVRGIQGISTDSEAGLQRIESLIDMLVNRRIAAVFTESSVSPKYIASLVEGAKRRGHEVRIGGELFSDAMGTPGTYEGTYIGMIDHNITTIVRSLGGTAPERGMQGKLTLGEAVDHAGSSGSSGT